MMRIANILQNIWFKTILIVLISFVLAMFIKHEILSISEFSPIKRTTEFKTSDLYSASLHKSSIHRRNNDVVIISANNCSREDIWRCLEKVQSYSPSVVAFDIIFEYKEPSDSLLVPFMDNELLVFASYLINVNSYADATDIEQSYFNDSGHFKTGVVNLSSSHIIRDFNPLFSLNGTEIYNCFAGEIVKLYEPSKLQILMNKEIYDQIPIVYHKVEFDDIPLRLILNNEISSDELRSIIHGKIVLIGVTNDPADQFTTPVADNYPGVYIHANIIDTILQENYISAFKAWGNYIISIIVCFVFIFMYFYLKEYLDEFSSIIMRVIQILILIILYYLGLRLYDKNIYMNCVMPMLTISFSTFVADIYLGIEHITTKYGKVWMDKLKKMF